MLLPVMQDMLKDDAKQSLADNVENWPAVVIPVIGRVEERADY